MKKYHHNDKLAFKFLDASVKDDSDLRLLGNFLRSCDYELLDRESLQAIGFKIIEYLDLKIVREHVFWNRPLTSYSGSEKDLKVALYAVREMLKD